MQSYKIYAVEDNYVLEDDFALNDNSNDYGITGLFNEEELWDAEVSRYRDNRVAIAKLSANGDEAWKDREAAVLVLGAIAEGCINGLYPRLSEEIHNPLSYTRMILICKFFIIFQLACRILGVNI
ncbi:hypothetical protein Q3G72_029741 [Acer saccharum]|nr:hypothetical protein Q3G72_029741 [Acer saccharum]